MTELSSHVEQLALQELAVAREQVAAAGATVDGLRADATALALRVDQAREESVALQEQVAELTQQLAEARAEVATLTAELASRDQAATRTERQLQKPGRLVVKKVLRRGPYAAGTP